jgi:adenylate cyclase
MHFKKAIALTDDKPSRAFVDRCRLYIDGKREIPAAGWEGIFTD